MYDFSSQVYPLWMEIFEAELNNVTVDHVADGSAAKSTLDSIPGFNTSAPPGVSDTLDTLNSYLQNWRSQNNAQIYQWIQEIALTQ
jgi:hypothetical protein